MAMTNCWECDKSISDNADKCPECGAGQTYKDRHPHRHALSLIIFAFIGFLALSPIILFAFMYIESLLIR
jgi:hypothetical protein